MDVHAEILDRSSEMWDSVSGESSGVESCYPRGDTEKACAAECFIKVRGRWPRWKMLELS